MAAKDFESQYSTAMDALELVRGSQNYLPELLRGAHQLVAQVVEASGLPLGERTELELRAVTVAGEIAAEKKDGLTAQEMERAAKRCTEVLEILRLPESERPFRPASTAKTKVSKAKR